MHDHGIVSWNPTLGKMVIDTEIKEAASLSLILEHNTLSDDDDELTDVNSN